MCESKVFLVDGDKKELLMEEAIYIKSDGKNITIRGVLGETRTIENARILLMDMDRHEVHIGLFR
jgi:predicted RNA-binding protein